MAEIDIVMSVNNEEFYISEMINSLKKQTFSDYLSTSLINYRNQNIYLIKKQIK